MANSQRLRLNDVRRLFHLLAETLEQWDDPDRWREHFLRGVYDVVGGGRGGWLHVPSQPKILRESDVVEPVASWEVGFTEDERRIFRRSVDAIGRDPTCIPIMKPLVRRLSSRPLVTMFRQALVPDRPWHRSSFHEQFCAPIGGGSFIISAARLPADGSLSLFVVNSAGKSNLEQRHARFVHLAHREVAALIGTRLAAPGQLSREDLTPRQSEVLDHLVAGRTEKQIAKRLHRSPATIHDHVLAIYRHFGVHSCRELMSFFAQHCR